MSAYYNEHDPFAAAWLRELIKAGLIAPGEVDERSIEDVLPNELRGYTQCHFFAGIGVWSYALRQAGWPDDRPVWTGSCPCQPFSAAGKRGGTADERHLWPSLYHLLTHLRPVTVFGEQVASKDGLAWFDTVSSDLEAAGYSVGAVDLCSAGFGAPHIRQRLYFVGLANARQELRRRRPDEFGSLSKDSAKRNEEAIYDQRGCASGELANHNNTGLEGRQRVPERLVDGGMADTGIERRQQVGRSPSCDEKEDGRAGRNGGESDGHYISGGHGESLLTNGFWANAEWIPCRDGKYRPIESGSTALATGITNRVGKLRGYGNALTAPVAQGFIEAFLETEK